MRSAAFLALLLVTACTGLTTISTTAPTTTTTASAETTALPAPTTSIAGDGCPEQIDFSEGGQVARVDQPSSDTNILGLISWQEINGCERFRFDFETTEGAPATTPPSMAVEFLASGQILRIHLGLETTVLSDQLVETGLVDRLFVVKALDGGMYVDLHLASPSQARAFVSNSPAALTVELQMGIEPFGGEAAVSERTVLVDPLADAETGLLLEVIGYSRAFEGTVVVIATQSAGVVAEASTQAADWTETWGEFQTSVELPAGRTSLFVGEESPNDGALEGMTVDITVR